MDGMVGAFALGSEPELGGRNTATTLGLLTQWCQIWYLGEGKWKLMDITRGWLDTLLGDWLIELLPPHLTPVSSDCSIFPCLYRGVWAPLKRNSSLTLGLIWCP